MRGRRVLNIDSGQREHPVQGQPGARLYLFGDFDHIHLADVFKGLQQIHQIDFEHIGTK